MTIFLVCLGSIVSLKLVFSMAVTFLAIFSCVASCALTKVFFVSVSQITLAVVKAGVGGAKILIARKHNL